MHENEPTSCEECGEQLFALDGEFYCPSCDSLSGFELRPDNDDFIV